MTGTVIFYNDKRGFGFLKSDSNDQEYFFHVSAINGYELIKGDAVSFEIGERKGRPLAVKVTKR